MDPALEDAARGLGRTRAQVFREVTLPVLRPSVGAGSVLVALYALSDFGVVSLMRYDALTRAVYQQYRSLFDRTPAALLGLVLVLLTAVVLLVEARGRGRGRVARAGAGAARPAEPVRLGAWRWPALAACLAVLVAALLIPVGTLVSWSLRAGQDRADLGELLGWAWNSVAVSVLAAAAATAAALPVAALAVRWARGWTRGLERATYGANALPGIVIALALVFFATRAATSVYQTLPLLVFAYVVRFLPQALAGTEDALGRVDPQLEQAARGLGATPARVFARVTAPLVAPGLLAGATLVFLSTMKELPVTLLLRPIGYDTLATEVWTATGVSAYAEAAAPALLLIALSAPVVYGLQVRRRPARAALVPQE
jgi:iron(III) transport system permease protein